VECVARQEIPHAGSVVCDYVSVSVGACSPCADTNIPYSALAHVADKALYVAKHQGRNRAIVLGAVEKDSLDSLSANEGNSRPEARGIAQRTPITMPDAAAI
jgi:hypothetical protein